MTTVKQYVQQMRDRQAVVARKLGGDVFRSDKTLRVLNLSELTLLAAVVKTLVDNAIITDAQLLATLDAARDDAYTDEPIEPSP